MYAEVMEVGCAGRLRPAACWSALGTPGGGGGLGAPGVGAWGGLLAARAGRGRGFGDPHPTYRFFLEMW